MGILIAVYLLFVLVVALAGDAGRAVIVTVVVLATVTIALAGLL